MGKAVLAGKTNMPVFLHGIDLNAVRGDDTRMAGIVYSFFDGCGDIMYYFSAKVRRAKTLTKTAACSFKKWARIVLNRPTVESVAARIYVVYFVSRRSSFYMKRYLMCSSN